MKKGIADRRERWRFTSAIGTCAMFIKGTGGLWRNEYTTKEIAEQAARAEAEVRKLAFMIQDRFKKGTP